MSRKHARKKISSFWLSRKGMAIPVTSLVLLVSLSLIISLTYSLAVERINSKTQLLKVSAAKQGMLYFEDSVSSVVWYQGSSQVFPFDDWGGKLRVEPDANNLLINITTNSFYAVVFNGSVGKAVYELAPSELQEEGLFLKGDKRVVINQSRFVMTQLYLSKGSESPEITLRYRPFTSSTVIGSNGGKPINNIRIYIIDLSSSQKFTLYGNSNLKIECSNVTLSSQSYNLTDQTNSLLVKVDYAGASGELSLPISSSEIGAIVIMETVICEIQLQRVGA